MTTTELDKTKAAMLKLANRSDNFYVGDLMDKMLECGYSEMNIREALLSLTREGTLAYDKGFNVQVQ
jgi:DNA-binding transcriptional regulator PaaX